MVRKDEIMKFTISIKTLGLNIESETDIFDDIEPLVNASTYALYCICSFDLNGAARYVMSLNWLQKFKCSLNSSIETAFCVFGVYIINLLLWKREP